MALQVLWEIVHNPSYELLFEEETKADLTGFEKGQESELGAVNVMTGEYTGRSPKDKFIVVDENSKDTVWWTSDEYKMTIILQQRKPGMQLKRLRLKSCPAKNFTLSMHSAVLTKIHAWLSALLWKLHGRHTLLQICLFSRLQKSLKL